MFRRSAGVVVLALGTVASAQDAPDVPEAPSPPPPPAGADADAALRARVLRDAVWAAVDAREPGFPHALAEVTGIPGATWTEVAGVLRAGRDYRNLARPVRREIGADEHAAYFARFRWDAGTARCYDLGDDWQHWYSVELPRGYDGGAAVPVWFDLGLFGGGGAPAGFARVELNPHIPAALTLGDAPMSMTAGFAIQSIVLSVAADLERRFRVDRDRVFCGGFSRMGNATWYEGVHWPDLWAGIAPAAGYYPFDDALLPNLQHVAVFAASGKDRGHRDSNAYTAAVAKRLTSAGHRDVTTHAAEGRAVDGIDAPFTAWIADRRRTALPKAFTYVLTDPRHRGAYWVEIVSVKDPGTLRDVVIGAPGDMTAERFQVHSRPASVTVEVTGPNAVRVRAANVAEVKLSLSPDLFDLAQPVRVALGSRTVEVTPAPTIGTLLRTYRRDGDPQRLFPAEAALRP